MVISPKSRDRDGRMNDSAKADARRAIEFAAEAAFKAAEDSTSPQSKESKDDSACDMSSGSHSSYLSRQRATHRGSKRGIFEQLEKIHSGSSYDGSSDREPTTATATKTNSSHPVAMKKTKSKFPFFKKKKSKGLHLTSEISKEAWMCGVCARSFSSFDAAEKHEAYHIREVVADLGWSTLEDGNNNSHSHLKASQITFLATETSENLAETPPRRIESPSLPSSHPRPDMLRYTPTNTPITLQRNKLNRTNLGPRFSTDAQSLDGTGEGRYDVAARPLPNGPMSPIIEQTVRDVPADDDLMVPHGIKDYVVLADEALVDVCLKAQTMILTQTEMEAEMELEWLAKDKSHYDLLAQRASDRTRAGTYSKFRTEGKSIYSKVQNKFVDAYQLMKEGKTKRGTTSMDHYNRKLKGDSEALRIIKHTQKTLYVNVIVKNSIKVVSHELERLAKERWQDGQSKTLQAANDVQSQRFQKFRAVAQGNLVKLAGLALASDFTPRRIAVQLSNDLYRLLTPRLKKRGVVIETEIEYRVGPYFVLAVNISSVDWRRLVKMTHRDVEIRNSKWQDENDEEAEGESSSSGVIVNFVRFAIRTTKLTKFDVLAQTLAWFYYLHWVVYTPICWILYRFLLAKTFREYFLSSVTDEIFYYVEEKGMEMDIGIRDASTQAAFMLSALREIRADGQELKKKQKEGESDKGTILGPLLGAAIKEDKAPAPPKPDGFEIPENLEYIGLELDLPVGFRRLRQAFLSSKSTFISEAVFRAEAKYDNIEIEPWNKHDEAIGLPTTQDGVKEEDFIGASKEYKYLMPRSAFVKANMCSETAYIDAYNEYCFCLKKRALTPEVPYGSTFVAWTKFVVVNTGEDTCRLVCSVEAEFPNGPPLVGRQIKSGMRAGVGELFVKIGETITKYADEFP